MIGYYFYSSLIFNDLFCLVFSVTDEAMKLVVKLIDQPACSFLLSIELWCSTVVAGPMIAIISIIILKQWIALNLRACSGYPLLFTSEQFRRNLCPKML